MSHGIKESFAIMKQRHTTKRSSTGFTIVEILVVIAIIGILATISIISYGSWKKTTITNQVKSDLNAVLAAMESSRTFNDVYPSSVPTSVVASNGVTLSGGSSDSGVTYCVTATSTQDPTVSYYVTSSTGQGTPTSGACPNIITNLAVNPSLETNLTGWTGPNSSVVTRDTGKTKTGANASALVTMPINSAATVGFSMYAMGATAVPTLLATSTTYTVSVWVYVPTGTVDPKISIQGTGVASVTNGAAYTTTVKDAWVQLSNTFTTSASGSVTLYLLNKVATVSAGTQFWADGLMMVQGTTTYTYADGNTTTPYVWSWTGTTNNSTSTGNAF
jgi:prepilin-type N-terminal cleavage/methylation domain-containing protein